MRERGRQGEKEKERERRREREILEYVAISAICSSDHSYFQTLDFKYFGGDGCKNKKKKRALLHPSFSQIAHKRETCIMITNRLSTAICWMTELHLKTIYWFYFIFCPLLIHMCFACICRLRGSHIFQISMKTCTLQHLITRCSSIKCVSLVTFIESKKEKMHTCLKHIPSF